MQQAAGLAKEGGAGGDPGGLNPARNAAAVPHLFPARPRMDEKVRVPVGLGRACLFRPPGGDLALPVVLLLIEVRVWSDASGHGFPKTFGGRGRRADAMPMKDKPGSRFASRRQSMGLAFLLFAITLALFWPATGYDFVSLDDQAYVRDNPDVREGFTWPGVKSAFGKMQEGLWIPMLNVAFMLDVEVLGPDPQGFHLVNIALHALNGVLFFVLLRRWTGSLGFACWGALIWALHPLRVESVAWISSRKDVLSGFFFLLCLWAYARSYSEGRRFRGWAWASAGFLALGLMSKSTLMAAPFLLLLLDLWPLNRMQPEWADLRAKLPRLVAEKWMFWLLGLASGALAVGGHAARESLNTGDAWTRLARVPMHLVHYLWKTVWPRGLNVLYGDLDVAGGPVAGALLVLAALTLAAWIARRRRPAFAVGWLWYVVLLLPVSGLVGFGAQSRADRYTYLPAMGLVLLLAQAIPAGGKRRRAGIAAGVASVLAVGLLTARHLPVWTNSGTLFARVLEADPAHFQGAMNRGIWLWEQGETDQAAEIFRQAWTRSTPSRMAAMGDDACRLVLNGRARLAQALLEPILSDPGASALVHGSYGMACLHLGEWSEAIRHLNRSLAMDPQSARFRIQLIRACFESGAEENARAQAALLTEWPGGIIRSAADLFPYYLLLWRDRSRPYAWMYFRRLAESEAENAAVLNDIAWRVATDRRSPAEAIPMAQTFAGRAVDLAAGENAATLDTLAATQAACGEFEQAVATGERAASLAIRQGDSELAGRIEGRLRRYRQGEPYWE